MKQVMIVTNPHPVLIQDLVSSLYEQFSGHEDVLIVSAQAVSLILEQTKGWSYNDMFPFTIKTLENNIDKIVQEKKIRYLIVIGTLEKTEIPRFDAIVGYDEKDTDGLSVFSDWPIETELDIMKLSDADAVITSYSELSRFVRKLYDMIKEKKM